MQRQQLGKEHGEEFFSFCVEECRTPSLPISEFRLYLAPKKPYASRDRQSILCSLEESTCCLQICFLTCSHWTRTEVLGLKLGLQRVGVGVGCRRGNLFPSCVSEACLMSAEANLDQSESLISQNNFKFMYKEYLCCEACGKFPEQNWSPGSLHFTLLSWGITSGMT